MDVVERARRLAADEYADPDDVEHPSEVARLVEQVGGDPEVVAAALLHDLIEDADVDEATIERKVSPRVAGLVAAMTEDDSIPDYEQRKAEHRARAAAAGRDCALIFVADKLSNARRMRTGRKRPDVRKLGHYAATLALMRREHPGLPLLDGLERELTALGADLQRSPA